MERPYLIGLFWLPLGVQKDQETMLCNIEMFYEARQRAIKLFHDYATVVAEVNLEEIQ